MLLYNKKKMWAHGTTMLQQCVFFYGVHGVNNKIWIFKLLLCCFHPFRQSMPVSESLRLHVTLFCRAKSSLFTNNILFHIVVNETINPPAAGGSRMPTLTVSLLTRCTHICKINVTLVIEIHIIGQQTFIWQFLSR
jgi:hypothetical protein